MASLSSDIFKAYKGKMRAMAAVRDGIIPGEERIQQKRVLFV